MKKYFTYLVFAVVIILPQLSFSQAMMVSDISIEGMSFRHYSFTVIGDNLYFNVNE